MTTHELADMKDERELAFRDYKELSEQANDALEKWTKLSTTVAREEMRRELQDKTEQL